MKKYLIIWKSTTGGEGRLETDHLGDATEFYNKLTKDIEPLSGNPQYEVGFYHLSHSNKTEDNGNQSGNQGNPSGV